MIDEALVQGQGRSSRLALTAIALGMIALILAIATLWLAHGNRGLQREAVESQQKLAKSQAIVNLDNTLVQMLAKAAIESDDEALRDLLARNGVQLKTTQNSSRTTEATSRAQ